MSEKRTQIGLRLPPELMARIEDWRAQQRPIPTLAEAARQLIETGLYAAYLDDQRDQAQRLKQEKEDARRLEEDDRRRAKRRKLGLD